MKRSGLSKSERIRKRTDFLKASRRADRRIETGNFLILFSRNQLPKARLGVTVTKKIGNAVHRNRLKRYVREFFRLNKHQLPPGYDIIIIARRGAGELNQALVSRQLMVATRIEPCATY